MMISDDFPNFPRVVGLCQHFPRLEFLSPWITRIICVLGLGFSFKYHELYFLFDVFFKPSFSTGILGGCRVTPWSSTDIEPFARLAKGNSRLSA